MTGSGERTGQGAGNAIREGVGLVHGIGEAIRGNVNAAVDRAAGDHQGAAKNQAIADRGVNEMETGHYHGTGAGVTPVDTERERQNRAVQGEHSHRDNVASSNYGPHSTNTGNKLDPRYDSDLDNRAAPGGYGQQENLASTNHGPHSTNSGNKLDPRYDSDLDHRGVQGGYGQQDHAASSNYGPHSTNAGNKLDPRYDSDLDNRGAQGGYGQQDNVQSSNYGPHSTNVGNKLDPRYDSDLDNRGAQGGYGQQDNIASSNYGPHSTNTGNRVDPRYDSELDHRSKRSSGSHTEAEPTNYGPHSTNLRNKLDPRYDSHSNHDGTKHVSTNYDHHNTKIGNRLDPRYDSDLDHRGPNAGHGGNLGTYCANIDRSDPASSLEDRRPIPRPLPQIQHIPFMQGLSSAADSTHGCTNTRQTSEPNISTYAELNRRLPHPDGLNGDAWKSLKQGPAEHQPHSTRIMNVMDPRVDSMAPLAEPHSTRYPHSSDVLNLFDPRVDRDFVRRQSRRKSLPGPQ